MTSLSSQPTAFTVDSFTLALAAGLRAQGVQRLPEPQQLERMAVRAYQRLEAKGHRSRFRPYGSWLRVGLAGLRAQGLLDLSGQQLLMTPEQARQVLERFPEQGRPVLEATRPEAELIRRVRQGAELVGSRLAELPRPQLPEIPRWRR